MSKTQSILAQKIKSFRKAGDMTQESLAKEANIPYTTLTKIESGVIKNPTLDTVMKIAEALNTTLDELTKE